MEQKFEEDMREKEKMNYMDGVKMITNLFPNSIDSIYIYDFNIPGKHTENGQDMQYYAYQVKFIKTINERRAEEMLCDLFAENDHFSAVLYSPFFDRNEKNKNRKIGVWSKKNMLRNST